MAATTMKAWRFVGTHKPLELQELPVPQTAKPGEVLIDIKAAGLCHSDVGMLDDPGWFSILTQCPITIGHEVAGVICAVGEGVTKWKVGDRVGVCPSTPTCPGYYRDGGFSSRTSARQEDIVRIPDNVTFAEGAAGTDAGMTSYHAVMTVGGAKAGMKVGIIGFGGLGQIGARAAVLKGCEVFVAEVKEAVWPKAIEAGCKRCVKDIKELKGENLDLIVDYAGFDVTTRDAVNTVRPLGRVVLVGMGKLESKIDTKTLILNQVQLCGSMGGDVNDVAGIYELFASGKLHPTIEMITFDQIPAGIDRLRAGTVTGRLCAHIAD